MYTKLLGLMSEVLWCFPWLEIFIAILPDGRNWISASLWLRLSQDIAPFLPCPCERSSWILQVNLTQCVPVWWKWAIYGQSSPFVDSTISPNVTVPHSPHNKMFDIWTTTEVVENSWRPRFSLFPHKSLTLDILATASCPTTSSCWRMIMLLGWYAQGSTSRTPVFLFCSIVNAFDKSRPVSKLICHDDVRLSRLATFFAPGRRWMALRKGSTAAARSTFNVTWPFEVSFGSLYNQLSPLQKQTSQDVDFSEYAEQRQRSSTALPDSVAYEPLFFFCFSAGAL